MATGVSTARIGNKRDIFHTAQSALHANPRTPHGDKRIGLIGRSSEFISCWQSSLALGWIQKQLDWGRTSRSSSAHVPTVGCSELDFAGMAGLQPQTGLAAYRRGLWSDRSAGLGGWAEEKVPTTFSPFRSATAKLTCSNHFELSFASAPKGA